MSGQRVRLALRRPGFRLDVDLAWPGHGITVLFGPSGSGKTTLLRCVAGLERAEGEVHVAGQAWQDDAKGLFLPPWRRPLGYVFQEASLFPHLTVEGNLRFAARRAPPSAKGPGVAEAVGLLGLAGLLHRRVDGLSGGERQRVAIARALAARPRVLLLDEPLASLDAGHRREILPWLERLRDDPGIPMLYVTHSPEELARLADTVVVLREGRAVACGPLARTLSRLDLPLAADEDAAALLEGRVAAREAAWHLARVDLGGGALWLADEGLALGRSVRLRVLARDVSLALQPPAAGTQSIQNVLACTVRAIAPGSHPSQAIVQLACGGDLLLARITARAADQLRLAPGLPVWAQVKSVALVR